MSDTYTPTTEEIQRRASHMGIFGFEPMRERQFRAWLAAHDAEVAAKAISDALESVRSERDAALARVAELEAEVSRLHQRAGMSVVRRREAEARIARIEGAMSAHPKCDVHDGDGPVTCGWKRAYESVQRAMEGGADD